MFEKGNEVTGNEVETRVMAIDVELYGATSGQKEYRVAAAVYDSNREGDPIPESDANLWQASGVLLKEDKKGRMRDLVTLFKSFFAWYNDWLPGCDLVMSSSSARAVSQFFADAFATGYLGGRLPEVIEGLEVEGRNANVIYVYPEAAGQAKRPNKRARKAAQYCAKMLAEIAKEKRGEGDLEE